MFRTILSKIFTKCVFFCFKNSSKNFLKKIPKGSSGNLRISSFSDSSIVFFTNICKDTFRNYSINLTIKSFQDCFHNFASQIFLQKFLEAFLLKNFRKILQMCSKLKAVLEKLLLKEFVRGFIPEIQQKRLQTFGNSSIDFVGNSFKVFFSYSSEEFLDIDSS